MGSKCILSISRIFNGSTCSEDPHTAHLLDTQQGYLQIYAIECTHAHFSVDFHMASGAACDCCPVMSQTSDLRSSAERHDAL